MENDCAVKFLNFSSIVDSSFWHKLCQLKLEEDKLEERERIIKGFFLHPSLCSLVVDCASFNVEHEMKLGKTEHTTIEYLCKHLLNYHTQFLYAQGYLVNFNSSKNFKECNKNDLIEKYGNVISSDIRSGKTLKNPNLLNLFILVTFVNLKTYEFIYWFAFPALSNINFELISDPVPLDHSFTENQINALLNSHNSLSDENKGAFAVELSTDKLTCITIEKYIEMRNNDSSENMYLCFLDPSSEINCPGWPLRNLLALVKYHSKMNTPVKVICLRIGAPFKTSFVLHGVINGDMSENKWVGWEKNKRDKFGPRSVNLQNDMDPVRLAESSADLNLKLMKWRLVPAIDLEIIRSQKCLLLGAGTLGCNVARCLLAWGVRHITFVDSGNVSFSNPVRQSLFNHGDCDLGKGSKLKAPTAAEALRHILPTVMTEGIVMEIPMPGHSTAIIENASKLHNLINDHDVIFLLTDSRESRWLPTVISSVLHKIAITAALGYDTYLVMRHGIKRGNSPKLGCYFCNDITAPGNSLEDRTLDQQCTVTRPGVSNMAAALAVELVVSLLQHEHRGEANSYEETLLGILPHSIRGFLSQFSHILPSTNSFSQCIACSAIVEKAYTEDREIFLQNVFSSSKFLEDLTGLTELHKLEDTLEDLELSDEASENELAD